MYVVISGPEVQADLNVSIDGPDQIGIGQTYDLSRVAAGVGAATISHWTIDWGDGTVENYAGNPLHFTHDFTAAAAAAGSRTITATVHAASDDYVATTQVTVVPVVSITTVASTVFEGDYVFGTVSRTGDRTAELPVDLALSGDAVWNVDYELWADLDHNGLWRKMTAPQVAIAAGFGDVAISIEAKHDTVGDEGNEVVTFRVADGPAYDPGSPTEATVTIKDAPAVDLDGDNDDDGSITDADDRRETDLPVILNINDQTLSEHLYTRKLSEGSVASAKLIKSGNAKFWLYTSVIPGEGIFGENDTEADLDVAKLCAADDLMLAYGMKTGTATLSLEVTFTNGDIVRDTINVRVVRADMIYRRGSTVLAWLAGSDVTHGGIDTSDDMIYDMDASGWGHRTETEFYEGDVDHAHPTKRRLQFDGTYMADRIRARVFDNLRSNVFSLPTGQRPWSLFSSDADYTTGNCLEIAREQWRRAINEVRGQLTDPQQIAAYDAAYYQGGVVRNLVNGVSRAITEGQYAPLALGAQLLASQEDGYDANKWSWDAEPISTYEDVYYGPRGVERTTYYLITSVAPSSYLQSPFFREVDY